MAGLRLSSLASMTMLLLSVLVLALAATPAQAWMNETRSVRRCNFTLSVAYQPSAPSYTPLELDNATMSTLFQAHLRHWMVDRVESEPANHFVWAIAPLEFANTLIGRIDSVVIENGTTGRQLARADAYVEGSFETEQWSCSFAIGTLDLVRGPLGRAVAASVDQTVFGDNASTIFSESQFPVFFFNAFTAGVREYQVLVPTDEDLCSVSFEGTYQLGSRLDLDVERPSASEVFYEEVSARVRLTYNMSPLGFTISLVPPAQLDFWTQLVVLKNESVGLTSTLAPAVLRTLERITDAPYDNSEIKLKSSRACYVPPPEWIVRCAQVSAKLESGAPFGLNTSATNSSTIFRSFERQLYVELAEHQLVFRQYDLQVQSVAAVPLELADTLQVAVRVDYEIDRKDEARGASVIGRLVTAALETTAVEVAPSSLYEVAYTITPCHAPSSTFFRR